MYDYHYDYVFLHYSTYILIAEEEHAHEHIRPTLHKTKQSKRLACACLFGGACTSSSLAADGQCMQYIHTYIHTAHTEEDKHDKHDKQCIFNKSNKYIYIDGCLVS
jgi:hypothetical protein